jgi:hypothetical protein
MNFNKFANLFQNSVIIDSSAFGHYGRPGDLRRQVLRWASKKYMFPLKRGMYILSNEYRKTEPSLMFVANQLLSPSYVSLEYALGVYGLIPEKVVVITSITTKKTHVYSNTLGRFEYKTINKKLFFGMAQREENEQKYFIAEPEKAVLDLFYFAYGAKPDIEYFESMRFQNLSRLNGGILLRYSKKFNKRVQVIAKEFAGYCASRKRELRTL